MPSLEPVGTGCTKGWRVVAGGWLLPVEFWLDVREMMGAGLVLTGRMASSEALIEKLRSARGCLYTLRVGRSEAARGVWKDSVGGSVSRLEKGSGSAKLVGGWGWKGCPVIGFIGPVIGFIGVTFELVIGRSSEAIEGATCPAARGSQ